MTRKELENKPHWQATFQQTRKPIPSFVCLLKTIVPGVYYWHTPEYSGLFPAGATMPCTLSYLADALDRGALQLVAGKVPACCN